jgi:hypothetical protein
VFAKAKRPPGCLITKTLDWRFRGVGYSDADALEAAADQTIAACGGDARETATTLPRDRKDWYD